MPFIEQPGICEHMQYDEAAASGHLYRRALGLQSNRAVYSAQRQSFAVYNGAAERPRHNTRSLFGLVWFRSGQ